MVADLTPTELASVVAGLDARRLVNRTVYGCDCGGTHGLACPARA